jgi:hypothetical protein
MAWNPFPPSGFNQGAYIDLKHCQFLIEDGAGLAGNVVGINAIGTTSIVVDNFVGEVVVGGYITIGTDPNVYNVVSQTPTAGNTTTIVLAPPLVIATTAAEVITVSGNVLVVKIGEGNLTFDEKQPLQYKKDRGLLDQCRLGDQDPIDVKFDFAWIYLSSPTGGSNVPTVEEAFKQTNNASAWVSTGQTCEPYAVNIVLINAPPCAGTGQSGEFVERILLPAFRYTSLNHDAKTGMVAVTGSCNALTAIKTRLAAIPAY